MGSEIINNAKTRRVSVCNALDTLIVDRSRLNDLPTLLKLDIVHVSPNMDTAFRKNIEKDGVVLYAAEN